MAETADFTDLSGAQLLDRVEVLHEAQRQAEVDILVAVGEFAAQHGEGSVDTVEAQRPGRERLVVLGGEGTPSVAEFAPVVFGARLGLSSWAARALFADVADLQFRLPNIWAALLAGEARVQHARYVARKTRELAPDAAGYVDLRLVPHCDGSVSWARFESLVEAAVKAADVAAAFAREQAAARRRFAKATRSTDEGMRGFYVRADFATIARIDATVAYLADALAALGDDRCEDDRRVTAVLLMANPPQAIELLRAYAAHRAQHTDEPLDGMTADPADDSDEDPAEDLAEHGPADREQGLVRPRRFRPGLIPPATSADLDLDSSKLLPAVWLFVHLAKGHQHADGHATDNATDNGFAADAGGLARVEGLGPVSTEWVRRVLGRNCRFKITPVLDPEGLDPVDGYEIPATHRAAQHALTPADVFPYGANTARSMQLDHTIAYDFTLDKHTGRPPPGQSRIGNYGPMTGFHHRVKTHGGWQVRQPFPGIYVWRDPYGAHYLVDPTGTRRIGVPRAPGRPPEWQRAGPIQRFPAAAHGTATTDSPLERRLHQLTGAA
jgi:hypothetical protein